MGAGTELGLGFRVRVRIRNLSLIGGAGGAHILMTSYACTSDVIRILYFGRKSPVLKHAFLQNNQQSSWSITLLLNGAKTLLCEMHAEINHPDNFHNANAALTYLQRQTKQFLKELNY